MDREHVVDEGTCNVTMSPKISKGQKDLISGLPDEILVHILSCLPVRDAVKTVLIRRFGNLWRNIPILDFDQCMYHECFNGPYYSEKFMNLIHQLLKFNECQTLDKLRLRFSFQKDYKVEEESKDEVFEHGDYFSQLQRTARKISSLVHYAISKKVKVLDLDLLGCGLYELMEDYTVPDIVLRNDSLTELRLAFCNIDLHGEICVRSLKVLSLTDIEISDTVMENILLGCPSLEDLSLICCSGLRKLSCTSTNLKKLALVLSRGNKWIISCPNIVSMEIGGCIECVVLLNVQAVSDATVVISRFWSESNAPDDVKRLLQKFSHCQTFKLCSLCILVFSVWELANMPCPCFNWKNLILQLSLTKWHHPGISLLLRKSQSLETLTINIFPSGSRSQFEGKCVQAYDFDGESYWNSSDATFFHLKNISIHGYITEPYVLLMVKFLLRSAIVLEKMLISPKKTFQSSHQDQICPSAVAGKKVEYTSEELQEFSERVSSFSRASLQAEIQFN